MQTPFGIATKLESGAVGVNCTSPSTAHDLPFGGYKSSGLVRGGIWTVSLNNFLETKSVLIKVDCLNCGENAIEYYVNISSTLRNS